MKVIVKNFGEVSPQEPCSIIDIIKMVNPDGLNNYCAAKINNESISELPSLPIAALNY